MKAIGIIQHNLKEIKDGTNSNLNLNGVPEPVKDMAIRILRRKRTSEAFGLTKEQRGAFRDAIRKASDGDGWLEVSDDMMDDLPFT